MDIGAQAVTSDRFPTTPLTAAFAAWCRAPWYSHFAALLVLLLVLTLRWWPAVTASTPLDDEAAYITAFEQVGRGNSPYTGTYFYPPAFAVAGAWATRLLGPAPVLISIRLANLLGVAVLAWISLAWLPWRWRRRVAAAALFLVLSPAVRLGVLWGNLSLALSGPIVVALALWRHWPWTSGLVLGCGVAVKPIAPVALLALAAHRPPDGGRRHMFAGVVGAVLSIVLLLAFPYLEDLLALRGGKVVTPRNVALHRVLHTFGLELSALVFAALIAGIVVLVARRWPLSPAHFLCFAVTATVLATPLVWSHTLLVTLPLQVLAVTVAVGRYRAAARNAWRSDQRRARVYELVLVILAALAIQFCEGVGGIDDRQVLAQTLAAALPAVAPLALTIYLLRITEPF